MKTGPRYQPLRTSRHFRLVFSRGKRCRVGGLTVVSAPNATDRTGIGLVAGRRVGTAVVRNRAKRRLRAALAEVGAPPGRDYVIVATRQVAEVPFRTLVEWLRDALER
ncbi:MAG: ribonuclease P protein component [bacterium]|nr:ribonuclease P protein component [bacterium]